VALRLPPGFHAARVVISNAPDDLDLVCRPRDETVHRYVRELDQHSIVRILPDVYYVPP
jgi:hypothetical protein